MNHDKLLREARELVNYHGTDREFRLAVAVGNLVNVVERQDKIIAEAVAACKVCAEVIPKPLKAYQLSGFYGELEAAGHLASRAVKLAEPERDEAGPEQKALAACNEILNYLVVYPSTPRDLEYWKKLDAVRRIVKDAIKSSEPKDHIEETLAHASTYHDELLKRLADIGDATNQAPETPMPTPSGHAGHDKPSWLDDTIEELILASDHHGGSIKVLCSAIRNVVRAHRYSATVAPVEVEMQAFPDTDEWHTWRCNLAGKWVYANHLTDAPFCSTRLLAVESGNAWLADVSKQLGVPLEAKWKEGE